jgi:hypothetical protein
MAQDPKPHKDLQESDRPRPHGDPMHTDPVEPNPAQRRSDATPDVVGTDMVEDVIENGSTANGVPSYDEDAGEQRKKLYKEGAALVSRID